MYDWLHWTHAALAILSGSGFIVRGTWRMLDSELLHLRLVRVLPHCVDSLLLVAGVTLAVWSNTSPLAHPWLLAKLVALPAYIGLGVVLMRFAQGRAARGCAFAAALACFGYMLAVAVTRQVLPWA